MVVTCNPSPNGHGPRFERGGETNFPRYGVGDASQPGLAVEVVLKELGWVWYGGGET